MENPEAEAPEPVEEPASPAAAGERAPAPVLLADHRGEGLAALASQFAARGHPLTRTTTLRGTLEALRADPPGLLLVDPLVRGGRSELTRLDAARHGPPLVPLLVVAERGDVEAVARTNRTLEAEAWDVLWRDAPTEELFLRVDRLLAAARRLEEMADLRHRASHDDRTDLLRPKAFEARLSEHFSATQRHGFPLAFAMLDLDDFGKINKRHDHTVGDYLIARVGEVIRRSLRTEDVAGRLGGDEFAVLLPYTAKVDAAQVVRRLREEIQRLTGHMPGAGEVVRVSASIGFETFDGKDLDSVESLRRGAERGLRAAKRAGGDRAVYGRTLVPEPGGAPEPGGGEPDPAAPAAPATEDR